MTRAEMLRAVRALLSDPAKWAREYYAFDADGRGVEPDSDTACAWCLKGAAVKVDGWDAADDLDYALAACVPPGFAPHGRAHVASFNDTPTHEHADVLRVLDCAIARAEA